MPDLHHLTIIKLGPVVEGAEGDRCAWPGLSHRPIAGSSSGVKPSRPAGTENGDGGLGKGKPRECHQRKRGLREEMSTAGACRSAIGTPSIIWTCQPDLIPSSRSRIIQLGITCPLCMLVKVFWRQSSGLSGMSLW